MKLLSSVKVLPLYGQVEIGDPHSPGYPQFETGDEKVVALPQRIVVATRADSDGPVLIEVWAGGVDIERSRASKSVYKGKLCLLRSEAVVGNTVGNDLHRVNFEAGEHEIEVLAAPVNGEVDAVYFVIDPK